jgi:uncharacterized membrane protein
MGNFQIGRRLAPWRFIAFIVILAIAVPVAIPLLGWGRGTMAGFDLAAAIFLLSVIPMFGHGEPEHMRQRARDNDANRALLLGITGATMLVILVAVVAELHAKSNMLSIGLVIATLLLAWTFSNTIYALHYAHIYYMPDKDRKDACGLQFPDCEAPDYWDFVYFSFTLGMTFQTSDVDIATRQLRRIAIGQCLAAFVFNLGVLAFTINVIGSATS